MTIKFRVIGAFLIVLTLLTALGVNSLLAIDAVSREAQLVEVGVDRTHLVTDFVGQVRNTIGIANHYAMSETFTDLERMRDAIAALKSAAARLDEAVSTTQELRNEASSYLVHVDEIIALVGARHRVALEAAESLTELQVLVSAIAERAALHPELSLSAVRLLENVDASGTFTFRYRASRDPADVAAAKRMLELAKAAFQSVAAATSFDHLNKLSDAVRDPLSRYEAGLMGLEASTIGFAKASEGWNASAGRLRDDGIKTRVASANVQRAAVTTMLSVISHARSFCLAATAIAICVGLCLSLALVRSIARPLVMITNAMRLLAAGRLETGVPYNGRRDEIGAMASAVTVFRDGLIRVKALADEKDVRQLSRQSRIKRVEMLNSSFEDEVGAHTLSLAEAAANMKGAAQALLEIAAHTNLRSSSAATAAAEASANVRLVAQNTEAAAATVAAIGGQALTSAETAGRAVMRAQDADSNVRALLTGAARIGDVVSLIRSIAQETNLLALNATIEAARAGEAGRGFAVVASEVKQLAVATGSATEEISRHVRDIQRSMQSAADTISEIRTAISHMDENTSTISHAVKEQSASIEFIASGAARAAVGADDVTANIAKIKVASGSTDAAARQVFAAAEGMAAKAQAMHERITDFLVQVRSA